MPKTTNFSNAKLNMYVNTWAACLHVDMCICVKRMTGTNKFILDQ